MATITSNSSGNWATGSTWVGGSVPAADDLVVIAHGHKVTINTNIQSTRAGDITIDGNLHFATNGKMHLHGRMTVKNTSHSSDNTGEFVEGTAASGSLLSMANGTEIKISGNNSDQHGIQVDARKWCGVQIDGSEPTLKTELNGNHAQESTYLTVDSSTNFAAGDMVSIYRREEDHSLKNDEVVYIHDIDTSNHRLYFRQYICPKVKYYAPCIKAVSGSTITLDDATVYRVGYKLIFGTGNNRNVKTITAINKSTNIVTLDSSVDNNPSLIGEYVYQTGTEKYHLSDSHVRRTSSIMTNTFTGGAGVRTININNAADFSVGDKIYIEACGDSSYTYASGSETNVWRHRLVYNITAINGLTLTVDRDILYQGKAGGLITRMTRDVVIKACDSSGNDVAYADQDTARVFFNVKYWTSTTWNNAPTRRVKIKYVEFEGLGYNTNDSTNFRAGVTIGGYNGYYDTKIDGSSADSSTIHTTSGVSQTGENYLDGCSFTSYNLCSNSSRDGDSYPGICIRHPYGMVHRNSIAVGAGRGIWHWSTQYFIKSHGHISAASNYASLELGAAYEYPNEISYMYLRMAEDYGLIYSHLGRQNDMTTVQHLDIQYMNSYCIHHGYASNPTWRRIYCDKYKHIYTPDSVTPMTFQDSRFMPNYWDGSSNLYGCTHTPYYNQNYVYHYNSGNNYPYRSTASNVAKLDWIEHGFREEEHVEMGGGITKLRRPGKNYFDMLVSRGPGQIMSRVFVPANTVVKLKSLLYVNETQLNGSADTIDNNSLPVLIAKGRQNSGYHGRHAAGVVTDTSTTRIFHSGVDLINGEAGIQNSTQAYGKLDHSFVEFVSHTTSAQGNWESKELTVAAQNRGYELAYGMYIDNDDMRDVHFRMLPIKVLMSKGGVVGSGHLHNGTIGQVSIRSGFDTNKKRISGRIK